MRNTIFTLLIILAFPPMGHTAERARTLPFFVPRSSSLQAHSSLYWPMYEGLDGWSAHRTYLHARLYFSDALSIEARNITTHSKLPMENRFATACFRYQNALFKGQEVALMPHGAHIDLRVGMIEWTPVVTDTRIIMDNAQSFLSPPVVYGATAAVTIPILQDRSLTLFAAGHSGDYLHGELPAELTDLHLNYSKIFIHNLGIQAQAGKAFGSKHLVNHAHLSWQPRWEKLTITIKAGKLPAYDQSPYGIHLGAYRNFKYVGLGGYYERRINQNTKGNIAGIRWSITGPPKVVRVVNEFNIIFDFNTTSWWVMIPLIKLNIDHE